jgi:hypothetical protein
MSRAHHYRSKVRYIHRSATGFSIIKVDTLLNRLRRLDYKRRPLYMHVTLQDHWIVASYRPLYRVFRNQSKTSINLRPITGSTPKREYNLNTDNRRLENL